jgi:hypothetical protein
MPAYGELEREAAAAAAQTQATALEATPPPTAPDAPQSAAEAAGYTGERRDESTYGGEGYDKDWDPAWERRMRKLLGDEMVGNPKALFDPKHRAWLRRQAKKKRAETKTGEASTGEEEEEAETPTTGGVDPAGQTVPATLPPAMANNNVSPRMLPSGQLPTGPIFQTTAGPWGSGWIPAGNGLYWPPWPTTGGPIAKPGPQRQEGAAPPMPRTLSADGQAAAVERA